MSMLAKAAVLCVSMCFASIAPSILRGHDSVAARPSPIDLEATIPREFGAWRERAMTAQVVNPQSKEMIDMLYSQVLTRTYVDDRGNGIMLTIAYGGDQRGNLEVHKPEVCYPAQGFTVHQNVAGELSTPFGTIAVRRLETSLGPRKEPVTYWTTLGNSVIEGRLQKRMMLACPRWKSAVNHVSGIS